MQKFVTGSRFIVIIPIIGLALAASAFFIFGGIGLIILIIEGIANSFAFAQDAHELPFEVEVVEHVHQFLIGTVLYITASGLYQLFISDLDFPNWLKIDSPEELETNLIGVTVVVLAVNFMSVVFTRDPGIILEYGAGIALPIAALALFIGLRTWSTNLAKTGELDRKAREKELQERGQIRVTWGMNKPAKQLTLNQKLNPYILLVVRNEIVDNRKGLSLSPCPYT